jgi:hypothetical protein
MQSCERDKIDNAMNDPAQSRDDAQHSQNLFFAFIYNMFGIPVAAGAFYQLFGWLLNPMIAGAPISLKSISVILRFHFTIIWPFISG